MKGFLLDQYNQCFACYCYLNYLKLKLYKRVKFVVLKFLYCSGSFKCLNNGAPKKFYSMLGCSLNNFSMKTYLLVFDGD